MLFCSRDAKLIVQARVGIFQNIFHFITVINLEVYALLLQLVQSIRLRLWEKLLLHSHVSVVPW